MIDYRIKIGAQQHPKIVKLKRRHGAEGVLALYRLWEYTAQNCSKGNLSGLDAESITIAANWSGGLGWVDDTVDLRLLDLSRDGIYSVHNWKKHNRFAYFSEERSQQSQKANEARWEKKHKGKQIPTPDRKAEWNPPLPPPLPLPSTCIHPPIGEEEEKVEKSNKKIVSLLEARND